MRIVKILQWHIPLFGNSHTIPYGTLLVSDGNVVKKCATKGDTLDERSEYQYITFNRKRYKLTNKGSMYMPKITLSKIN